MHCGDLGVFCDAIGGLFFVEMSHKLWHRSYAHGVAYLNAQLALYYRANPTLSQINLTVGMIKGKEGGNPTLRSKAAECRHLSGFALVLAHRHAQGGAGRDPFEFPVGARLQPYSDEYKLLVVKMAASMHRYHDECVQEPFVVDHCKQAMHDFCRATTDLRLLFRRHLPAELHATQPFSWRPKGHMLEHLVDDKICLWGSPREFWCYGDEDFVGLMKRIAQMTKHPKTLENLLLQKFRLHAALHAFALTANEQP